ncbi:MAG TPA: hypothetical protein VHH35_00660 [Pyrinomonadaceae bacterium]|nr:hypothetical protein [Pyrinomonadaceae bacterium]
MNCTSAREYGGNTALVDEGKERVGWPGAPGWTTTGGAGLACWAVTVRDNRHPKAEASTNRMARE